MKADFARTVFLSGLMAIMAGAAHADTTAAAPAAIQNPPDGVAAFRKSNTASCPPMTRPYTGSVAKQDSSVLWCEMDPTKHAAAPPTSATSAATATATAPAATPKASPTAAAPSTAATTLPSKPAAKPSQSIFKSLFQ